VTIALILAAELDGVLAHASVYSVPHRERMQVCARQKQLQGRPAFRCGVAQLCGVCTRSPYRLKAGNGLPSYFNIDRDIPRGHC